MAKFIYNNYKNTSISHNFFEFNYSYNLYISFEDKVNPCLSSCLSHKLAKELRNLILIYQQNLFYTQKLQKQVYDKGIKFQSYILGEKIWLNSKYFKIKENRNFNTKFFNLFRGFHLVSKQAYKLKLNRKFMILLCVTTKARYYKKRAS